ncbi:MAG: ethanolamine ammonia-lyase light chain EutC [Janthinobacterium lividum]
MTATGAGAEAGTGAGAGTGAANEHKRGSPVLSLVIADGLSALAIEQQALPFLQALLPMLGHGNWRLAPVAVVSQARVAIGDEIGALLGADVVMIMIGERPGLSSPDSMGLYLTWAPRQGLTDERRNCISNVRQQGLPPALAAGQLLRLLDGARQLGSSGVVLKIGTSQEVNDALTHT